MALAPGVRARLWGHHLRRPSRAGNCSTGRSARYAHFAWGSQAALAADSASGWDANCRYLAIGPHLPPNRRARADPDSRRCQSVYPLAQRFRCGSGRPPGGKSYWRFAHCCPRRSPARMVPGVGTGPTRFHRARTPARARVGQKRQAAEPGENCLLLSYMARRQRRLIRPMGVRRQNRSRLAVWMVLVADQDSGRGFLRRGADAGFPWRATDRRPYNATFLPLCLSICWKYCYCVGCHR